MRIIIGKKMPFVCFFRKKKIKPPPPPKKKKEYKRSKKDLLKRDFKREGTVFYGRLNRMRR